MTTGPGKRGQGMTLAEVMVFLVLVSMAILALVGAQIYALRANTGSRQRTTASTIAYSELNQVLSRQRQDFSQRADRARARVEYEPDFESAVAQLYYPDGRDDLKQIFCSVYWTDKEGAHEFSTWTYVYRGNE